MAIKRRIGAVLECCDHHSGTDDRHSTESLPIAAQPGSSEWTGLDARHGSRSGGPRAGALLFTGILAYRCGQSHPGKTMISLRAALLCVVWLAALGGAGAADLPAAKPAAVGLSAEGLGRLEAVLRADIANRV